MVPDQKQKYEIMIRHEDGLSTSNKLPIIFGKQWNLKTQ